MKMALFGAMLLLAACVGTDIEVTAPFVPAEAAFINQRGAARLSGQAFMRQMGGGVVTCAGEKVRLIPATAYARERISKIYGTSKGGRVNIYQAASGKNMPPAYLKLMRIAICDAEGDFEFNGVANGAYYIATRVIWYTPGSYVPEGGGVARQVTIRGGRSQRVILN